MNPNAVARAYCELESEGIIEVRHGSGACVAEPAAKIRKAGGILRLAVEKSIAPGLAQSELRHVFESEISRLPDGATAARRRT